MQGAAAWCRMLRELESASSQPHSPLDRELVFGFVFWGFILLGWKLSSHLKFSVQPPEYSHSYKPLCSAPWLCFQGRKGLWVLVALTLYPREGASNLFSEVCCAQMPGVWPRLLPPRPGPAALPMIACS